jgi:hypothetical protein
MVPESIEFVEMRKKKAALVNLVKSHILIKRRLIKENLSAQSVNLNVKSNLLAIKFK